MKLFIVLLFTLFCSLLGAGIVAPLLPVQNAMGTVMGIVLMGQSAGIMIGPIAAGAIADYLGIPIAFFSGALVALAGLFFFLLVGKDFTSEAAVQQALSFKEV